MEYLYPLKAYILGCVAALLVIRYARNPLQVFVFIAASAMLVALTGCGGGGDDYPDVSIGPPDCRAHPEICK